MSETAVATECKITIINQIFYGKQGLTFFNITFYTLEVLKAFHLPKDKIYLIYEKRKRNEICVEK